MDVSLFQSLQHEALHIQSRKGRFSLSEFCFHEQFEFINDKAKFKVAVCSRRSGKTTACAAHLVHEAITKPGRISLYITLSRLNAKRIIWSELLSINSRYDLGGIPNETELSIRFQNGSTIYLTGAKDKSEIEKFRGLAISLCYIDECQSFRSYIKGLIDDVIGPALMDYAGTLCLIGTPGPVPTGYFYECAVKRDSWSKHGWTYWQNPFIEIKSGETHQVILDRELSRRGVGINDASIQREWFGKWVIDENSLVFRYYKEKSHYDHLPALHASSWSYVIGVDLGFDDADAIAIIGWNKFTKESYLVEEYIQAKQGITELAEKIGSLIKKYDPMKVVMDTGGLGKKISEELQKRYSLPITSAEKSRKFEYIEILNDAMRTGRFFAKESSAFAQDCMMVEWDKDKSNGDKLVVSDKFHSDICDAVLYAFREALHWLYEPEIPKANMRDRNQYISHTQKLMDEHLERQIQTQKAHERGEDIESTMGMDEGETLSHYLNKRRA